MARIFTIGHSTSPIEEFLSLLNEHGIEMVADIRSFPGSRKFPHFGRERLQERLAAEDIRYEWYKDLGGFRKKSDPESPNTALTSPGFRNYADYTATETFRAASAKLLEVATNMKTAVMCAERLFWRCHRRILSDYLVAVLEAEVIHIVSPGKTIVHTLTEGAQRTGEGVIYPP